MTDEVIVDGKLCTEEELLLTVQYMARLYGCGIEDSRDMIRWARKELAKPDGKRPL